MYLLANSEESLVFYRNSSAKILTAAFSYTGLIISTSQALCWPSGFIFAIKKTEKQTTEKHKIQI